MCVFALTAFAQNQQTDEYNKNEFYLGYSNQQIDAAGYNTANGFQGSYVRNIKRYLGIKADVSGAFDKDTIDYSTTDQNNVPYSVRQRSSNSTYNFLGGVQFKDNASKARFRPFAHALGGVALKRSNIDVTCTSASCPSFVTNNPNFDFNSRNLAFAVGGGLDIRINDKIDFRAIQVDFNPIWRGGGYWEKNVRIGVGIVFK
jgi:opacity protein-like surface antigen